MLSSINLLLPTVALYLLSMSDFGRHLERVIPIKVFYQLMHLLIINIPFLGVRIYLWNAYNYELSLFVVKNLCYIFMLMHSLYPGKSISSRYLNNIFIFYVASLGVNYLFKKICGRAKTAMKEATSAQHFGHAIVEEQQRFELQDAVRSESKNMAVSGRLMNPPFLWETAFSFTLSFFVVPSLSSEAASASAAKQNMG